MDFLIKDRKWIYSVHAFILGPLFVVLSYFSNEYSKGYTKYQEEIKLGYSSLFWIGILIILYHSYKLLVANNILSF